MTAGGRVVVSAPAKLTLSLRVTGVRADGLHELDAEMVSIDLCDELVIDPDGDGLEVVTEQEGSGLETGARNLVTRALAAVDRRAGVRLVKRVPVGGGLGGGSSDAGAVLRWAGCADLELAARLGSDVPFCVRGGRARVRGIGERVEVLDDTSRSFVLLVPPMAVDTAAVYRAYDALGQTVRLEDNGRNDLTIPAIRVAPELARWRDALGDLTGRPPQLAGSGATWFVEGTEAELRLPEAREVTLDAAVGRLVPVRTVDASYGSVRPIG
jgi:4-diphosphocytidyl-2-C-methyl-D-erythritol kinase